MQVKFFNTKCDSLRYPVGHRKTAQPGKRTLGEETREQGKGFYWPAAHSWARPLPVLGPNFVFYKTYTAIPLPSFSQGCYEDKSAIYMKCFSLYSINLHTSHCLTQKSSFPECKIVKIKHPVSPYAKNYYTINQGGYTGVHFN